MQHLTFARAMLCFSAVLSYGPMFSCLSRVGVLPKWMDVSSWFLGMETVAAPAVQQSIDISYPPGPLQQTHRTLLQRANWTDRQTL